MSNEREQKIGTVALNAKDASLTLKVNALAFDMQGVENELLILSGAGPSTTVKAFCAAMTSKTKAVFRPENIPGMGIHVNIHRHAAGYHIYKDRLSLNYWHVLAICKRDGLLTRSSEHQLWKALRDDRVSTPCLRHWTPWIKKELEKLRCLRPVRAFGCEPAVLDVNVPTIDEIVSRGVSSGQLKMTNDNGESNETM